VTLFTAIVSATFMVIAAICLAAAITGHADAQFIPSTISYAIGAVVFAYMTWRWDREDAA
jgi:putative Ca2+/H+ antiporter (TMEM165/GDT1 family)